MPHIVVQRRGDFHNVIILDMQGKRAPHATIWADGVRLSLFIFFPGAGLPQLVLTTEHQRASRADANTIATIDAG